MGPLPLICDTSLPGPCVEVSSRVENTPVSSGLLALPAHTPAELLPLLPSRCCPSLHHCCLGGGGEGSPRTWGTQMQLWITRAAWLDLGGRGGTGAGEEHLPPGCKGRFWDLRWCQPNFFLFSCLRPGCHPGQTRHRCAPEGPWRTGGTQVWRQGGLGAHLCPATRPLEPWLSHLVSLRWFALSESSLPTSQACCKNKTIEMKLFWKIIKSF